jgi:hypothetical protein
MEEVKGGWRKLHSEELCNLYSTPNITLMKTSRRMRWVARVGHMGDKRNAYSVLVGKHGRFCRMSTSTLFDNRVLRRMFGGPRGLK